MSNLDSYKNIQKYTDILKNLSFTSIILIVATLIVLKTCLLSKLTEPDFEKDFYGNPILAEHGFIELDKKIDISSFHVANAKDNSIYQMNAFKDKILILILWSTNCSICGVELRNISTLTDDIQTTENDVLQFVTIADQQSDPDKIVSLFQKERFNRLYSLYAKKSDFQSALSLKDSELPRYFVVNRKGIIFAEIKHPYWYKKNILEPFYAFTLTEYNETTDYDLSLISEAMEQYRSKQKENTNEQ